MQSGRLTKVSLEDLGDQWSIGEGHTLERLCVLFITSALPCHVPSAGLAYGGGDIGTGDSLRWRVEEVECARFTNLGNDL